MSRYCNYVYSAFHKSLGQYEEIESIKQSISNDVKVDPPVDFNIINNFQCEFVVVAKMINNGWTCNPMEYVVYRNGGISDIQFNGWTFQPRVNANHAWNDGYYYRLKCLSPSGKILEFNLKNRFGSGNILGFFDYISKFDSNTAEFLIPLQVEVNRCGKSFTDQELIGILDQIKNRIEGNAGPVDEFVSTELKKTYNNYLERLLRQLSYTKYAIDD